MTSSPSAPKSSPFQWWEYPVYWVIFLFFTLPLVAFGLALRMFCGRPWKSIPPNPVEVKNVLIVQVENLGDFLISAGFSRAVREAYPNARLTIAVDAKFQSLIRQFPYFDETLGFDQSGGRVYRLFAGPVRAYRLARKQLWKTKFDIVLNQRWDTDSKHGGVLGMFALGDYHLGFSSRPNVRKRLINIGLDWMYAKAIDPQEMTHDGLRGAQLLESIGLFGGGLLCEIFTTREDDVYAEQSLASVSGKPLLVLGIGASLRRRQWPIERYGELSTWLLRFIPEAGFLVVGHAGDGMDAERLRPILGDRLLNFAGKCSLSQSAALLRHATAYFGTESGPMHMCAAVGVPLVTFYVLPANGPIDHPNSSSRYHPVGSPRVEILNIPHYEPPCSYGCKSDDHHCVKTITVAMAKDALARVLDLPVAVD